MVPTGLHEQDKEWYRHGYTSRIRNGTDRATRAGQGMVPTRLHEQDKEWYRQDIHALVSLWHKAVEVDGDYVEK
jgi:hypothetical protein